MSRQKLSVRRAVGDAMALGVRRPVSVILWGLVSLLFTAGLVALLCWMFAAMPGMAPFGAAAHPFDAAAAPDPADMHAMLLHMVHVQGASSLINILALVVTVMLMAAVTRAALGQRGLGYMRLGMDEFRVLVIQFAFGLGAYFLFVILAVIGVGIGLAAWPLEPPARYAVIGATVFVELLVLVWVCLRASLITPMTVAVGQFSFIEGWRLTRGRFWRLLGIALLSTIVGLLISLLTLPLLAGLAWGAGATLEMAREVAAAPETAHDLLSAFEPDRNSAMTAAAIVALPLAWVWGLSTALAYGPWASAYRQLAAGDGPDGGADAAPEPAPPAGHDEAQADHGHHGHDGHDAHGHDSHGNDSHGHDAHHDAHGHDAHAPSHEAHAEGSHEAHGEAHHAAAHDHHGADAHDPHPHAAAHDDAHHGAHAETHQEAHPVPGHDDHAHGHDDHGHADHGHAAADDHGAHHGADDGAHHGDDPHGRGGHH